MKKTLKVILLFLVVVVFLSIISLFVIKNNFDKVLILIQEDMSKGKYDEALIRLENYSLLKENNKDYMVWYSFILANKNYPNYSDFKESDFKLISEYLKKIDKLDNKILNTEDIGRISFSYFVIGDYQNALVKYLQLSKTDNSANLILANIYNNYLKDFKKADQYYSLYLSKNKDNKALYEYSFMVLQNHHDNSKEDVYKALNNFLDLVKSQDISEDTKLNIYISLGDLCFHNVKDCRDILGNDCDKYYNEAEKINPYEIGLLYSRAYNPIKALGIPDNFLYYNVSLNTIESFKTVFTDSIVKLKDLEKRNPDYWIEFLLGYALEFNKDFVEARSYLLMANRNLSSKVVLSSKEETRLTVIQYHLARVDWLLGKEREAQDYLLKANQLQKDFLINDIEKISQENILMKIMSLNRLLK